MNIFFETIDNLKRNPVKGIVTFLSVGVGVGVLIFALSASSVFSTLLEEKIDKDGLVLTVANAEYQSDGTLERIRPSELDADAMHIIDAEIDGASLPSPVFSLPFNDYAVDGTRYTIRGFVGGNENYLELMDLDLILGSMFTAEDVENGARKVLLSETTAIMLYGSVDGALGQNLASAITVGPGGGRGAPPTYQVTGIYSDPDELKRTAYGVADAIAPYTAIIPSGGGGANLERMLAMFASTFQIKVEGNSNAEAQIREVLAREYGDDITIEVWEGSASGPSTILEETRNSVRTMTVVINLLGFILLISGTIGILSIMLVEVLGKSREIAIERALGSAKSRTVKHFMSQSVVMSAISAVLGLILAYVFGKPLSILTSSIFEGLSVEQFEGSVIRPIAVLVGVVAAVGFGGLFGAIPVFSVLKTPIAEGIREG